MLLFTCSFVKSKLVGAKSWFLQNNRLFIWPNKRCMEQVMVEDRMSQKQIPADVQGLWITQGIVDRPSRALETG